jgi:RNA polymerase sigma-70 factor (ECF subfamily)
MSALDDQSTERLLAVLAENGEASVNLLFERCRPRLKNLVSLRLDTRLQARIDPSDVVQETLIHAHQKLPQYLAQSPLPLPFYAWLRQIAIERIVDHHRRHLHAQARSVKREQRIDGWLPDHSTRQLANQLIASGIHPESQLRQAELKVKLKTAIAKLPEPYREVLVIKFLEQMSTAETAAVLGIAESSVRSRQLRALRKLKELLAEESDGETP